MARDGSWSTGSWKASPWRDGPRRREADSGPQQDKAAPAAATGNVLPGPTGAKGAGAKGAGAKLPASKLPGAKLAGANMANGARLADLREWHIVEARCARCRHVGRLRPKQLTAFVSRQRRQLAGQTPLADIADRFACTECGNRAGNAVAIVAVERNV